MGLQEYIAAGKWNDRAAVNYLYLIISLFQEDVSFFIY